MTELLVITQICGFVALLLWGVRMVQTGVQRAYGPQLRSILSRALNNRLKAFMAGLGVTLFLQSSTATALMATSLAVGGLIPLATALAVMLGANIGTTLIVQLMAFDVGVLAPVFILIGVVMFRRGGTSRTHDLGRVLVGLGLMVIALLQLVAVVAPYQTSPGFQMFMQAIEAVPLINVIIAAVLAWAMHSSVAVILVVASLAGGGIVSLTSAFALVLGANLGAAVNPLLEGPPGDDPAAKRLPVGNLINRLVGVVVALAALPVITPFLGGVLPDGARAVASFHMLFNIIMAALFLPLLTPCATLLKRLLPARVPRQDPSRPLYLSEAARETPVMALASAGREALRLADILDEMLGGTKDALIGGDRKRLSAAKELDDVLDGLNGAIKTYLTSMTVDAMSEADHERQSAILNFVTNIEHAGDLLQRDVLGLASKRLKRGLSFSKEERADLDAMLTRLSDNLHTAAGVFLSEDKRAARMLANEKQAFREIQVSATADHYQRLREGRIEIAETTTLFLDLVRDIKHVNAHIVAAAAYPVLQRGGELLKSRLR